MDIRVFAKLTTRISLIFPDISLTINGFSLKFLMQNTGIVRTLVEKVGFTCANKVIPTTVLIMYNMFLSLTLYNIAIWYV